jgi:thioredoxin reductase
LGLHLSSKGPLQLIEERGRVPLIDIGTLDRIRDGGIRIARGIDRLTSDTVVFCDGKSEEFDAVILATGYRPDLRHLMPGVEGVLDRHGMPLLTGRATAQPGLFFCGQITAATGQFREIGREARRIAVLAKKAQLRPSHLRFPWLGRGW